MEADRIILEFIPETPEEAVASRKRREQFDRNSKWLQDHILKIGENYRGKTICVAGEELFVGDTARDAIAQARKAHPEDTGYFTRYIPKESYARIYALPW
jgi:hypothetical protein